MDDLIQVIRRAPDPKTMIMCSYCYDDLDLHRCMLSELKDHGLQLRVVVDKYYRRGGVPYHQNSRLGALAEQSGASVRENGTASSNMHYKICVVEWSGGQVAYMGGSNATNASRTSWECVGKHVDAAACRELKRICEHCWRSAQPCRF